MPRIIAFNIENKREDYARVFHLIQLGKVDAESTVWAKSNVKYIETSQTEYQEAIKTFERSERRIPFQGTFQKSDIIYFRVNNKPENDVTHLHYFFLASKQVIQRCCLAIFPGDEHRYVEPSTISTFLLHEMLSNRKNQFQLQPLDISGKKNPKTKYLIQLKSSEQENVFILKGKSHKGKKVYLPDELNKRRLSVFGKCFPFLWISKDTLPHLQRMAKEPGRKDGIYSLAKQGWDNRAHSELIYKDALYSIASRIAPGKIKLTDESALAKAAQSNPVQWFDLPELDITQDILSEFCKKCFIKIVPKGRGLKEKHAELFRFLGEKAETTNSLAFCLFLMFWRLISEKQDETYLDKDGFLLEYERDDLLIDAQDYADGLLQLLENMTRYAMGEKGILCLRAHDTDPNEHTTNDSRVYLKRNYQLECTSAEGAFGKKYFLEVLLSDYNSETDIPQKFKENIQNELSKPVSEREYEVSDSLWDKLQPFQLKDFFNYDNAETHSVWREFYGKPKNLISHYGLLIFEHLVSFADGAFYLRSSSKSVLGEGSYYSVSHLSEADVPNYVGEKHISGTQYQVLLPIGIKRRPRTTGLNAAVNVQKKSLEMQHVSIATETYACLQNHTNRKSAVIEQVCEDIWVEINFPLAQNQIYVFDVSQLKSPLAAELFAKVFMRLFATHLEYAPSYFAFTNATDGFLAMFIRTYSLLYLKTGQSDLMKDRQLYLCSPGAEMEILFYGNSLDQSVEATFAITTLAKGQPLREGKILLREAEKAKRGEGLSVSRDPVDVLPFDCILPGLFQAKVKSDLCRNIRDTSFGCCLEGVHVRVGGKIHSKNKFYEASLLLSFSSYVSRFAFSLIKQSRNIVEKAFSSGDIDKLILVGYETYSENLMLTLKESFQQVVSTEIDYVIYDETNNANRFSKRIEPSKKMGFLIVVPVGSTLTTHDKVASDLWRNMLEQAVYQEDEKESFLERVLLHCCVVLVRDSGEKLLDGCSKIERRFWDSVTKDSHVVYNKENTLGEDPTVGAKISADNKIYCFVSVEAEWSLPEKCDYCFPKLPNFLEKPLIQSNRASVVPMIMYGKKARPVGKTDANECFWETTEALLPLRAGLKYGHVIQDRDNHFEYYFQSEKIMEYILSQKPGCPLESLSIELKKMLEQVEADTLVYDFIVAPLHKTNAAFVQEVNKIINAKQIIWLDVKREFRSNVVAKYSNLRALYKNFSEIDRSRKVQIRFHFVDDSIATGTSFYRAKSLLQSLFSSEALEDHATVKVCLFESVTLLIDRCSQSTRKNFVQNGHFYSHIRLDASSMRSHSDACVPCKNFKNFSDLIECGIASNTISSINLKHAQKFDPCTVEELAHRDDLEDGYAYLVATHHFNQKIAELEDKDCPKAIEQMLWSVLNQICVYPGGSPQDGKQYFLAALHVLSRPFLSFQKSVLSATTCVMQKLTEYCLVQDSRILCSESQTLKDWIDVFRETEVFTELIDCLFSCLANMNLTYLLRLRTMHAVLNHDGINAEMLEKYIFYTKQVLCLGEKSTLSVWLEHLLETGTEHYPQSKQKLSSKYRICDALILLRLENTGPICTALSECREAYNRRKSSKESRTEDETLPFVDVAKNTLKQYFCESYRLFAGLDDNDKIDEHCKENGTFVSMLRLYCSLAQAQATDGSEALRFYDQMLVLSAKILDVEAKETALFIKRSEQFSPLLPDRNRKDVEHTLLQQLTDYVKAIALPSVSTAPKDNGAAIGDTLFFKKAEQIAAIKFCDNAPESASPIAFYLAFKPRKAHNSLEQIALNARNLLAMRSNIAEKLISDFTNTIIDPYLTYSLGFDALSSEKSGSHTPYKELSEAFEYVKKSFDATSPLDVVSENFGQLKVIADSLVSRWYVHSVVPSFPENFSPRKTKSQMDFFLDIDDYSHIWELLPNIKLLHEKDIFIYPTDNSSLLDRTIKKIQKEVYIDCIKENEYMWISAFILLYYNALRHGKFVWNNGRREVEILVSLEEPKDEDPFILIRNEQKDKASSSFRPITLPALQYFFDNYYSQGVFSYGDDPDGYFAVKLPIKINKSEGVKDENAN